MKNFFKITATIIILSLSSTNVFAKSDLKIGAILPLSGEHELIGKNIYHSILITIFELKNLDIKIIPLDTQSTEAGAKKALSDGIEKKVDVFIGPIFIKTIKQIKDEPGFKDKIFISYSNHEEETYANVVNFGVNLSSQINALKSQFEDENDFIFLVIKVNLQKKFIKKQNLLNLIVMIQFFIKTLKIST